MATERTQLLANPSDNVLLKMEKTCIEKQEYVHWVPLQTSCKQAAISVIPIVQIMDSIKAL